jgi:hypothetical protein
MGNGRPETRTNRQAMAFQTIRQQPTQSGTIKATNLTPPPSRLKSPLVVPLAHFGACLPLVLVLLGTHFGELEPRKALPLGFVKAPFFQLFLGPR